ncbi:MAG: hypothetical protein WKG07_03015 [Hymenobacter sp.]
MLAVRMVGVRLVNEATARAEMQRLQTQMMAEQMAKTKAHSAQQLAKDDAAIQAYLKKNKLTAKAKKRPAAPGTSSPCAARAYPPKKARR